VVGNILVVDSGNNRVQVFDRSGHYKWEFGGTGAGPGQFMNPAGIAALWGKVIVADSGNNRVEVFTDSHGHNPSQFGSLGTGLGQFNHPQGIGVGLTNIVVTDTGNDRVQVFDLSGNNPVAFGSTGAGNGQFQSPSGAAAIGILTGLSAWSFLGQVEVLDPGNDRLEVFRGDLSYRLQRPL
jgi:DNA-binding beta-propeller fold protein YncE